MAYNGQGKGATSVLNNVGGRLEIDRSLHQDRYIPAPGVAGPSRYTKNVTTTHRDHAGQHNAFDMGSLRNHLAPAPQPVRHENWAHSFVPPASQQHQNSRPMEQQRVSSPWHQDFMESQSHNQARQEDRSRQQPMAPAHAQAPPWQVPSQGYRPQYMPPPPQFFRPPPMPPQPYMDIMHPIQPPEQVFHRDEIPQTNMEERQTVTSPAEPLSEPQELLARTARDLVNDLDTSSEILRDNPKLAQSQFMQLMRGLGNGEVVVEDGKARINGEEINEGAKFVSRPAGDWASAFVAAPAKEDFQQVRTLPATLDMPTFEERMRFGQDTMYTDQSAITHPTEAEAHRPGGMRRKSVHFDEADMSQALGSGVPNNLEEALRSSTSIPGMQASWEGGLDFDDFDETSFMNYNGQLRQSTDDPKGVGQVENWGGLQRDWEDFQRSNPMVKGGQTDRYLFQTRNPYASMAEDADLGRESPTLKGVLELEAAVQQNPSDHEAWYALGLKQQENEREDQAIRALAKVIDLDPDYRPAYLALAVSYTNEATHEKARVMLGKWIDMANVDSMSESEGSADLQGHQGLVDRLIDLARRSPEEVDPDVQIALGVLFNSSEEYTKAEDCFLAALSVRPDDWLLYNRLGATLANSGRSNEAISYYHQALSLHPNFVRALFNLGISYINLAQYPLAAQHIISAIRLQHTDATEAYVSGTVGTSAKGVTSDALWNSLRTACLHMGRHDLVQLAAKKDVTAFPDTFDNNESKSQVGSPPYNIIPVEPGVI